MRIAHITDTHVVEPGGLVVDRIDPTAALERAVATILALEPPVDLVVASGDLVNDGGAEQYGQLVHLLEPLAMPIVVCPGNHDDRTELRSHFADVPAGGRDDPIDYSVDHSVGESTVRFVVVDTTTPGEHGGEITAHQLAWLDRELADSPHPVVVVQHHPPFLADIAWMDGVALADIDAEADVLTRHGNVRAVLCGHYHRPISVGIGAAVGWCAPSSTVQIDLTAPDPTYTTEPPAFALHHLGEDGSFRTHIVALIDGERWRPAWSTAADE